MALYDSAALLQMWRDQTKRPTTDAAWPDATVYRLLSRAQVQVMSDIAAVFPRLLMAAPIPMTTTDGGLTYVASQNDSDGTPIYPMGHAEVYGTASGYQSRELYGSTYAGRSGDVVFEGNKIRLPQARARTATDTLYLRCVVMPESISTGTQPTLQPYYLRELIVLRACELWAGAGGQQDGRPYAELYAKAWSGNGQAGSTGFLGLLTTQYARSHDATLAGIQWWRWWIAQGGAVGAYAAA